MSHQNRSEYVLGIDGLRAIAVLSVMLYHFAPALCPGGFTGVDVFFVISGYVVSGSLTRGKYIGFKDFALRFYARRIVRIYPALIACLVGTMAFTTAFIPKSWLGSLIEKTGLFAFFGVSNFALILFDDGYFSPRAEFNVFTHTWSLAVEEQFYFLFPGIFFFWLTRRLSDKRAKALLPLLLTASLLFAWYLTETSRSYAFYHLPSRFWELAAGVVLFQWHHEGNPKWSSHWGLLGLILIFVGFAVATPESVPFPGGLLPVIGAILAIGSGARGVLEHPILVLIGKMSYSVYLWHWPVIVLMRWTSGAESVIELLIATVLTGGLSAASYFWVETPVRAGTLSTSRSPAFIVVSGAGIIFLSAALAVAIYRIQPYVSLSVTRDLRVWQAIRVVPPSEVPVPRSFAGRRLFVFGDSHALAYTPLLEQLKDLEALEHTIYFRGGCTVANLLAPERPKCITFIEESLEDIERRATPGDIVFLAARRAPRLCDQWKFLGADGPIKGLNAQSPEERASILGQVDELISRLERAGVRVVIEAPKPLFSSPAFRCSDWFNAMNPICHGGFQEDRAFLMERTRPIWSSLEALRSRHPGLVIWDAMPILCPNSRCSAFDDKGPLFIDGDHLSGHGNRVLYPHFRDMLGKLMTH